MSLSPPPHPFYMLMYLMTHDPFNPPHAPFNDFLHNIRVN